MAVVTTYPVQSPTFAGFLALIIPAVIASFVYDFVDGITNNPLFTILLGFAIAFFLKDMPFASMTGLAIASIGIASYIRQFTIKLESE